MKDTNCFGRTYTVLYCNSLLTNTKYLRRHFFIIIDVTKNNFDLLKQNSLFNNGLNYNGLIGAFQSADRRYLEYVDGSIMNDGSFSDVGSHFFGDVYGTGPTKNVFTNVNLSF